jgi:hypothetical protein
MKNQSAAYFENNVLYEFNCLLLLTTGRFIELNFYIINHLQRVIVLVITKVDQEIANEHEDHSEKPLQEVIDSVLQDLKLTQH